ncbi:hypothetical protein [uncultured Tateyamaria sp.]|uniref:hypothetical protein n=1 Tax=Tateyamaria sp. 1078 TaxID=3417464 RepID=UPI00262F08F3|nr:hypothetical protein [uncultured Tateyamaria sp.]
MTPAALHTAPEPQAHQSAEMSHFAHRRAAIDLIATLRARMVRCALFGTYLLRPHPITPEDEETRAMWRAKFEEQHVDILRAYSLLEGRDPTGALPPEICA